MGYEFAQREQVHFMEGCVRACLYSSFFPMCTMQTLTYAWIVSPVHLLSALRTGCSLPALANFTVCPALSPLPRIRSNKKDPYGKPTMSVVVDHKQKQQSKAAEV